MQNNELEKKSNRLLSCPFCGGEAKLDEILEIDRRWLVRCQRCFCRTTTFGAEKSAVITWNTRKPMERIVEQLESLVEYNSEQAEIYHNVEKEDAYTREMKDLYIERTNCFGVAIRTVKGGVDNG